jgi:TRAP-type mannitol/chloroaromatic compound transport system permease small subunit
MKPLLSLARAIDRLNDGVYAAIKWLTLLMIVVGAFNALARYATRYTGVAACVERVFRSAVVHVQLDLPAGRGLWPEPRRARPRGCGLLRGSPRSTRAWIDLLGTLLFLIPFCVMMLVTSWPAVRNSWAVREGSPDPGGLPRYPIKSVAPDLLRPAAPRQALALLVKKAAMPCAV